MFLNSNQQSIYLVSVVSLKDVTEEMAWKKLLKNAMSGMHRKRTFIEQQVANVYT